MKLNKEEKQELIRIFNENNFEIKDIEEVAFYLEREGSNYLGDEEEVVNQWAELMGVNFPIDFLDHEYIVDMDEDWEELSDVTYVNTYRLFEDDNYDIKELQKRKLIYEKLSLNEYINNELPQASQEIKDSFKKEVLEFHTKLKDEKIIVEKKDFEWYDIIVRGHGELDIWLSGYVPIFNPIRLAICLHKILSKEVIINE